MISEEPVLDNATHELVAYHEDGSTADIGSICVNCKKDFIVSFVVDYKEIGWVVIVIYWKMGNSEHLPQKMGHPKLMNLI